MSGPLLSELKFRAGCAAFAAFLILISALRLFPDFFERVESALYDQQIRLAGPARSSDDLILLNIDDASLRELGRWPWDRSIHARALRTLTRCEAGQIVYDIVFHGKSSEEGDRELAEAVRENGNVLLPAGFSLVYEPETVELKLGLMRSIINRSTLELNIPDPSRIPQADRGFLPLAEIAAQDRKTGHISASPDNDGVLRRIPLVVAVNGKYLPAIGLEAAMTMLGASHAEWKENNLVLRTEGGNISIPVDDNGHMAVNFSGRWGSGFSHLSFADVIAASGDDEAEGDLKELVRGKTVIVSLTSSGSTDIGPTAASNSEPLATMHSNAINTILQQAFIRSVPWQANMLAGTIMVTIVCLLAYGFGPRRFVLASGALLILYIAAAMALFICSGTVFNLSAVIYSTLSCFLVSLGLKSLLLFAENESRRIEREKLQIQLDAAARIQSHFWPETPDMKNGDKIFSYSSPALFVGGDLYDFIPLDDGSWIIYLADVSGKGLPAALIMASAWTQIKSSSARLSEPDALLETVNRKLYPLLVHDSNFVTILMLRYYPQSGRLKWVNGGHMKPLILGAQGLRDVTGRTCMPIGIFDEAEYAMEETILEPGESCIMMSDGVTEAENSEKQLFGDERVAEELVKSAPNSRGEQLAAAVRSWRGATEQNDDTTIVEIMRVADK